MLNLHLCINTGFTMVCEMIWSSALWQIQISPLWPLHYCSLACCILCSAVRTMKYTSFVLAYIIMLHNDIWLYLAYFYKGKSSILSYRGHCVKGKFLILIIPVHISVWYTHTQFKSVQPRNSWRCILMSLELYITSM